MFAHTVLSKSVITSRKWTLFGGGEVDAEAVVEKAFGAAHAVTVACYPMRVDRSRRCIGPAFSQAQ